MNFLPVNKSRNKLFETIYHQHQSMVHQMCLGFLKGNKDIANDLLQEVFISVWSNLNKFKGKSTYKTWIYRITVNTCLQYIRKEKKEKTLTISGVENQITANTDNSINQNIPKLYQAIGQLKKIDRLIIIMVLENQDYDDISEIIGISAVNVRVKIHRIKKHLETILKQ
jgi:RNA polymerase sigma-70 factor (ECF subfamily)